MNLADARRWFVANGGNVRMIGRTADHAIFQIEVGPHVSAGLGVEHGGRQHIPESDPQFQKAFVQMVESLEAKIRR
ncbi:MAG TPA: hypothetical protein VF316_05140 [Polyangiaceae bacterium]